MNKKLIKFFMVFLALTVLLFCFPVFGQSPQQLKSLPKLGENLVVTEDSVFTVDAGVTATLGGNLTVWGQGSVLPVVHIIVHGTLVVEGSITCNRANLTIQNEGTLMLQNTELSVAGVGSMLYLNNNETLNISETNFLLLGGSTYLTNYGSITGESWKIEARQGRIDFNNDGEVALFGGSFSSTAPSGIFNILNNGDLQLDQSKWKVTGGGLIGFDGRFGFFLVNGSIIEGSGEADGVQSRLIMYTGNTTLIDSTIDTNDCSCVYQDTRTVNIINSVISGIDNYNGNGKIYVVNSTISNINNYNNVAHFFMVNGTLSGINNYSNSMEFNVTDSTIKDIRNYSNTRIGTFSVTDSELSVLDMNLKNDGKMVFVSSSLINRGGTVNILNDAELYSRGLILKTESDSTNVYVTNNGNITFTTPFIEQVTSSDLTSIGAEEKQFAQSSGGMVAVINFGSIKEEAVMNDDYTFLVVVGVLVAALVALFVLVSKKKTATVNNR